MKKILTVLLVMALVMTGVFAQAAEEKSSEAKELVIFNAGTETEGQMLIDAFTAKYPNIKVTQLQADSSAILSRIQLAGNSPDGDVVVLIAQDSLDAMKEDGAALVLMGHGTAHTAKVTYSQMATMMGELGYDNVFIGTVEGEPEETACDVIIDAVKEAGYTKVYLRPLMVVAGDHANNDMAGDEEDSWKSVFEGAGYEVVCLLRGLGENETIRQIYVDHAKAAIDSIQ